jgi:hypothetical protein
VIEQVEIPGQPRKPLWKRWAPWCAFGAAVSIAAMAWGYYYYYPSLIGPAQPISFSHRVHVTDKQISCVFCHPGVVDTRRATIPPLEKCMLCHERIITEHPQIQRLWDCYYQNKPVHWARVGDLPDFVFFDHEAHIRVGFDCGKCHGDVAHMDRVTLVQPFQMGFCVQCHRDEQFSHDCWRCHR